MSEIDNAKEVLDNGGIIIFPTDTAFGIGCRIDKPDTIERLFKLRKRPADKPVPVLVSSIEMAKEYALDIPISVRSILDKYWPGALTIVIFCNKDKVPNLVRGGGDTVGIRMPNHKLLLQLIEKVGVPILGPSANFGGNPTPYKFEDMDPDLIKFADYVLEGETGGTNVSTVIDCSKTPWRILRQGAVKLNL